MLIERPQLTMPEAEAKLLRLAYADAGVILEYGSGGSTVVAAECRGQADVFGGKRSRLAGDDAGLFRREPAAGGSDLLFGDIGPTKAWSFPKDEARFGTGRDIPWRSGTWTVLFIRM